MSEVALWGQDKNNAKPKLLTRVRIACQEKYYSPKTARSYVYWIRQFILFHNKTHPAALGKVQIENYLNYFVVKRCVSPSTQGSALNAIVFLYRHVLNQEVPELDQLQMAKRQPRVPVVLSTREVGLILENMFGTTYLMAQLIYGTGMRISECVTLRIKDIDYDQRMVIVRTGKGNKDRVTVLPKKLIEPLTAASVKNRSTT